MKGLELYHKARTRIPGATQLLSKRAELHAPEQWPPYYARAKGAEVWDLDGRKFVDMSYAGIGSCILGYADADVDDAVRAAIDAGSMCTLNAPEEVELADLLCELHPWGDMVRYARCGGEAMAVAVRIARARSGREKVAFCGYHGWHDWYLAANLPQGDALDGHLLPGLAPAGVPASLSGTALPFHYNRLDELERIVAANRGELAAIVMEPVRSTEPLAGFLESVRALADDTGAVLVFDEVTAAFRATTGGIHLVTQRPFLPAGTLRAALTLSATATDDRLWEALRSVGLDGFVASLQRTTDLADYPHAHDVRSGVLVYSADALAIA